MVRRTRRIVPWQASISVFAVLLAAFGVPAYGKLPDVNTDLLAAVQANDRNRLQRILDEGADPNTRLIQPKWKLEPAVIMAEPYALMLALKGRHYGIANLLIDHGADINAQDAHGRSVLIYAVSSGDSKILRKILEKGGTSIVRICAGNRRFSLQHAETISPPYVCYWRGAPA